MFILSIFSAIIIGYMCRGKLKNLASIHIEGISYIFYAFSVEVFAKVLLREGIIELGIISYILHLVTYILLFIMIYKNIMDNAMKFVGMGFLLNAIVIFSNQGIMPVGKLAMERMGIPTGTTVEGMYRIMEEGMHFKLLADILPIYLKKIGFIISIGDLFIMLGMIIIIVKGMKKTSIIKN